MAEWGVDSDLADDAELLVTELVTNAVIHARTPVHVDADRVEGRLEFAIADASSRPVELRVRGADDVTGRGVFLLDQLTPDWEVVPLPGGKKIRFSLPFEKAQVAR